MLKEEILKEIKERGEIPFDRFVYLSLYHPKWGYYTGKRGSPLPGEDFVTAPEISPVFGKVLAFHLKRISEERNLPLRILELGGGKGFLAKDILGSIPVEEYIVLELGNFPPLPGIRHVKKLEEVPSFEGFVVSNEFFDAFPFKRILKRGGKLFEVFVGSDGDKLTEFLLPFKGELPCEPEEGGEYPLFVGWKEFLKELKEKFKGYFIAFDYGGKCKEVSSKKSFRAYRNNRIVEDYLERPGETDLTADVDFDRLFNVLSSSGFSRIRVRNQSEFLLSEGIEKAVSPSDSIAVLSLLVDMGRRFKVIQAVRE